MNFKNLMIITGASAAVALMGLTGCSTWSGHRVEGERTAGRVVDDSRITADVQKELRAEPVYKFNDIDVKTFNGTVQLSGFVNTEDQKRKAAELAQHVPGVAQVVNSIALKTMAPTPTGRPDVTRPDLTEPRR
jgi:osmotically-inducible protein OsmY